MKIGDRVTHKTMKFIKSEGTVVNIENPFRVRVPFLTASMLLDARVKVRWDKEEYGESDWINESDIELCP